MRRSTSLAAVSSKGDGCAAPKSESEETGGGHFFEQPGSLITDVQVARHGEQPRRKARVETKPAGVGDQPQPDSGASLHEGAGLRLH